MNFGNGKSVKIPCIEAYFAIICDAATAESLSETTLLHLRCTKMMRTAAIGKCMRYKLTNCLFMYK